MRIYGLHWFCTPFFLACYLEPTEGPFCHVQWALLGSTSGRYKSKPGTVGQGLLLCAGGHWNQQFPWESSVGIHFCGSEERRGSLKSGRCKLLLVGHLNLNYCWGQWGLREFSEVKYVQPPASLEGLTHLRPGLVVGELGERSLGLLPLPLLETAQCFSLWDPPGLPLPVTPPFLWVWQASVVPAGPVSVPPVKLTCPGSYTFCSSDFCQSGKLHCTSGKTGTHTVPLPG